MFLTGVTRWTPATRQKDLRDDQEKRKRDYVISYFNSVYSLLKLQPASQHQLNGRHLRSDRRRNRVHVTDSRSDQHHHSTPPRPSSGPEPAGSHVRLITPRGDANGWWPIRRSDVCLQAHGRLSPSCCLSCSDCQKGVGAIIAAR